MRQTDGDGERRGGRTSQLESPPTFPGRGGEGDELAQIDRRTELSEPTYFVEEILSAHHSSADGS